METRKVVFRRSVRVFCVVGVVCVWCCWRSAWKPKTLCGVRGGFHAFGELVRLSGIRSFRGGLLHIRKP